MQGIFIHVGFNAVHRLFRAFLCKEIPYFGIWPIDKSPTLNLNAKIAYKTTPISFLIEIEVQ